MNATPQLRAAVCCAALLSPLVHAKPLHGWNGWVDANGFQLVQDLNDAENEGLDSSGKGGNNLAHRLLPEEVEVAETATLYFTFRLQDSGSADLSIGLSAEDTSSLQSSPSASNSDVFGPQLRVMDNTLQIRDGGSFLSGPSGLEIGVTYHVWMTAYNQADTWELQIRGGAYTATTQIMAGGKQTFAFRGSTGALALTSLVLRANNHNAASNGVLLDNFHLHVTSSSDAFPDEVLPTASLTGSTATSLAVSWTAFPGNVEYILEAGHPDGPPFAPVTGGMYEGRSWTGPLPEPGPHGLWFRLVVQEEP